MKKLPIDNLSITHWKLRERNVFYDLGGHPGLYFITFSNHKGLIVDNRWEEQQREESHLVLDKSGYIKAYKRDENAVVCLDQNDDSGMRFTISRSMKKKTPTHKIVVVNALAGFLQLHEIKGVVFQQILVANSVTNALLVLPVSQKTLPFVDRNGKEGLIKF